MAASVSRSTPDCCSSDIRADDAIVCSALCVTLRPATLLETSNSRPLSCCAGSSVASDWRSALRFASSRLPAAAPAGAVASPWPLVITTLSVPAVVPEKIGWPCEPSSAEPAAWALLTVSAIPAAIVSSRVRTDASSVRANAAPARLPDPGVIACPSTLKLSVPSAAVADASVAAVPPCTKLRGGLVPSDTATVPSAANWVPTVVKPASRSSSWSRWSSNAARSLLPLPARVRRRFTRASSLPMTLAPDTCASASKRRPSPTASKPDAVMLNLFASVSASATTAARRDGSTGSLESCCSTASNSTIELNTPDCSSALSMLRRPFSSTSARCRSPEVRRTSPWRKESALRRISAMRAPDSEISPIWPAPPEAATSSIRKLRRT